MALVGLWKTWCSEVIVSRRSSAQSIPRPFARARELMPAATLPAKDPADLCYLQRAGLSRWSENVAETNSVDSVTAVASLHDYQSVLARERPMSGSFPRTPRRPGSPPQGFGSSLLAGFPDSVLGAVYCALNLPCSLLRRSCGLGLRVASHLADSL
jgi:hypothetical protein